MNPFSFLVLCARVLIVTTTDVTALVFSLGLGGVRGEGVKEKAGFVVYDTIHSLLRRDHVGVFEEGR